MEFLKNRGGLNASSCEDKAKRDFSRKKHDTKRTGEIIKSK